MRAVVQRVGSARVLVDDEVVGELALSDGDQGLLVLVGATHADTVEQSHALADKIWRLRILDGPDGTASSAADLGAPLLVVSQFTLYANTEKGRRPSWSAAAPGAVAAPLVDAVVEHLRVAGASVATGRFGAHMQVESVNDGPVTILLEV
ncbi:D-tyrosyl-tRNA(Tyr) deacylase [Gordonia sp. X0973]|uniref:D-aminoacyl-tRNA deacylase n=1 Tax=Gordonia sp. X0973 TaxID=2742602 RepID=UPI000F520C65|nr:D-aminoacyl-tRNA deacylase [Gordonia sp. X0973]QKT08164.1 D-tyrosyl-tRNA(Tyr) deacylase [Gordonia sp. X0973]